MKQFLKKMGGVFLALCMVVTMLPGLAIPAYAGTETSTLYFSDSETDKAGLYTDSNYTEPYTSQSDKWSYDSDTNTLSLNGFYLKTEDLNGLMINNSKDLKISLSGFNVITALQYAIDIPYIEGQEKGYVSFSGDGSLIAEASEYGINNVIYQNLFITGGDIYAKGGKFGINVQRGIVLLGDGSLTAVGGTQAMSMECDFLVNLCAPESRRKFVNSSAADPGGNGDVVKNGKILLETLNNYKYFSIVPSEFIMTDSSAYDLPTMTVGEPITPVNVSGAVSVAENTTYTAIDLPAGIIIDSSTGIISGTPTTKSSLSDTAYILAANASGITRCITIAVGKVLKPHSAQKLYFNMEDGKFYLGDRINPTSTVYFQQNDKYTWDSNTKTLTFKGFKWETTCPNVLGFYEPSNNKTDINIILEDSTENVFVSTADAKFSSYGVAFGKEYLSSVTIAGNGVLTAEGGTAKNDDSYGIYSNVPLTIEDGDITASSGTACSSNYAGRSNGIKAIEGITISGGTVTAKGNTAVATMSQTNAINGNVSVTATKYCYWTGDIGYTPSGPAVSGSDTPFGDSSTESYVKIVTGSDVASLMFTDNAGYDIPTSKVGTAITNINVSDGVCGGTAPYTFSASGLPDGISISSDGAISGTPETPDANGGIATITVSDATSQSKDIMIEYGTISAVLVKSISIGAQSGTLTTGTKGSASFTVTTANIADGTTILLNNTNNVIGINMDAASVDVDNLTEISINTTADTPQGKHPLTLTIDGITSENFDFVVAPAPLPNTYTVTVNGSYTSPTGANSYTDGTIVSIRAGSREGYTFSGWTSSDGVNFTDAASTATTFTMPSKHVTVTANWSKNDSGHSGGGHSSGGNSGGSSSITTPTSTVSGSTATTKTAAKTGADGKASASVTKSQMSDAIKAAQKAAQSNEKAPRVEIQVSGASDASTIETTLPKTGVQAMKTGKMESLTLSGPVATMDFDAQAIDTIAGAASGDVVFTASNVENSTLSDMVRQVVGDHPVYDFSVTSGDKTISQFNGIVTISLPYTPVAGEDVDAIVAYYINGDGEPELMQDCYYEAKVGALVFTTTHFSQYAVGYNKVAFSDVADTAWYADAVSYLAARGITGGISETTFGSNAMLTRGQLITLLMRAYSIDPDDNSSDNFSDAGNTYYTGYLASAKRLGISGGIGDNKFAPNKIVTRQEMFTLLYNALKVIGQLPEGDSGKMLSDFTDSSSVSSYAQEAMAYLVKAGAVSGNNGQLLTTAATTRAQMAQVLYNLLKK